MVHAFRSKVTSLQKANTFEMRVTGTYNMDQKITVEWEYLTVVEELAELFRRLPTRPYTEAEIRFFVSGHFYKLDRNLPDTKISEYRVSPQSLVQILEILEMQGVLQRSRDGDLRAWTPTVDAHRPVAGETPPLS